jgi:hypothetical protein
MQRLWNLHCVLALVLLAHVACGAPPPAVLSAISDEEFWRLGADVSEPEGTFPHDDNLVSNETQFPELIAALDVRGGAYVGVGPEQNFTYIARQQPVLAFIVDIRRANRDLHLMYKALFEMSADRADFLSRLFSRTRPAGLEGTESVGELFDAFDEVPPLDSLRDETTRLIQQRLLQFHGFPLTSEELSTIARTLAEFSRDGPDIRYGRALPPGDTRPSYRRLMTRRDHRGIARSYLASHEAFATVRDLHTRNRIVPVVGDFAGPRTLRRIGDYLRQQGYTTNAFYASNVEVYLLRDERRTFCANLGALPYNERTLFVGNRRMMTLPDKLAACTAIRPSLRWR